MTVEEIKRLDVGRQLLCEIKDAERYLDSMKNESFDVSRAYHFNGYKEAHVNFTRKWVSDHIQELKRKFEAL